MTDLTFDYDYPTSVSKPVETPHGVYRAVLTHDDYAHEPDYECGCPVIEQPDRWGASWDLRIGQDSARHDGLEHDITDYLERATERTGSRSDAIDLVDRWLRTFHGGSMVEVASTVHQGGPYYVTYDTRAMREHWGQTGETLETSDPSSPDWQAYIDGEVYLVSIEQATFDLDDDGTVLDTIWDVADHPDAGPVGGHYGEDWAEEAAAEMLGYVVDDTAADMLPLGE